MIKNLGQVAAIYIGSAQPSNTNIIWLDNTVIPFEFRAYDGETWSELAKQSWVKAYINGWLVSLPPSDKAEDGDYLLINSGGVNYKITAKEFVKSAVGNPLDFKGVIRTDSDFPNPDTCEAGDMYVIITSPTGGTVRDPYSGETFEDTEKIVWDEVTKKWESLGKIDIVVDMDTVYAEDKITITNTTGKSTDIAAASETQAGVMSAQMYYWLKFLSDGTVIPPEVSASDPNTPAHQHNYDDIVDRLIAQQSTGQSTRNPMSQKATTDALDLKFDKANVVQEEGAATDKVMSQKATTDALDALEEWAKEEFTKYLKLAGGTMTGNIILNNDIGLQGKNTDGSAYNLAKVGTDNIVQLSSSVYSTRINSKAEDLIHGRNGSNYKIWDAYNLPDPATLSGNNTFTGKNTFNGITNYNDNIIFANAKGVKGKTSTGVERWMMSLESNDRVGVGDPNLSTLIYSNDSDLTHYRKQKEYSIWDKYNLPDPATLSGTNTFTGYNTFNATVYHDANVSFTNGHGVLGRTNDGTDKWLINVNETNKVDVGSVDLPLNINTSDTDIQHRRAGVSYAVWDKYNLPSPITSSDLASYATQSWVESQGYMTDADLSAYATQSWVKSQGYLTSTDLSSYATKTYVTSALGDYLPLTGGTVTGQITFSTGSVTNSIRLNSTGTTETFIQIQRSGAAKAAIGYYDDQGAYIYGYDVNKYLFLKSAGVYYGTPSAYAKLLTSADLGGYATQDWVKSQQYLTDADLSGYATQSWVNSQGFLESSDLSGYATQNWVNSQGFLQSNDLTSYATQSWVTSNFPEKDGTGATGTWGINISGSAQSCTDAQNAAALGGVDASTYVKSTLSAPYRVTDIQVLASGSTAPSTEGILYIILES